MDERAASPIQRPLKPSDHVSALINFDCPNCGQNIDAEAEMRGMEFPCPTCEEKLTVPGQPPAAEQSGAGHTTLRKRCHGCGAPCPPDTVICVDCGYNFNTREQIDTETAVQQDAPLEDESLLEDFDSIETDRDFFDAAESRLAKLGLLLNEKGAFEPPPGPRDPELIEFMEQLNVGRIEALELRREHKRIQPLGEQAFDPLDNPLPNIHSLAILFDRDCMDDAFGWQMLLTFLRRVKPSPLRKKMVLHAGSLLGFQNLCAIVARSQAPKDLVHVADRFGVEFQADWILPHNLRFLRADKSDGHRLPRAFSIPIELILEAGVVHPDANGVAGRTITPECAATTDWRLPEWTHEPA